MNNEEAYKELWNGMFALNNEAALMRSFGCEVKAMVLKEKAEGIKMALRRLARPLGLHVCPNCLGIGIPTEFKAGDVDTRPMKGYYCGGAQYDECVPFGLEDLS